MTRAQQKRYGTIHHVDTDGFTLCGRWAGRHSYRPTRARATCAKCRHFATLRRRVQTEARYDELRTLFTAQRAA